VLDEASYQQWTEMARRAQAVLRGRVVWNVNSTARGGGVAEMLHSLVAYPRGAGVDSRWIVIRGDEEFFRVTKRMHNLLLGVPDDGGELDDEARTAYERPLARAAAQLVKLARPGDVVLLHDPQTAAMVPALARTGARVVWRCHIGVDEPNVLGRSARSFLLGYLAEAHGYVFSHAGHVWDELDLDRVTIIAPSIDAFSPKNEQLAPKQVIGILQAAGVPHATGRRRA
jgi:trehalose synthase